MSNFNVELFETYLKKRIRHIYFDEFKRLLIQSDAVIAGGSLLGVYANDIPQQSLSSDIDIYLHPSENALLLKNYLERIGYFTSGYADYTTPGYDESFMMRNNIIGRVRCVKEYIDIDFIFVSPSVTIESVVSNFDLTFCEIWYDGTSIQATYPNDIILKNGSLKPDYLPSFLKLNKFTLKRIEKYINRGFKVSIKVPDEMCQENINFKIKKEDRRKILDSVRWFVFYMYGIISKTQSKLFEFICSYPLREISVEQINEIMNTIKNTNIDNRRVLNRDNYIEYLSIHDVYMSISNSDRCKQYISEITGIEIDDLEVQYDENVEDDENDENDEDDENDENDENIEPIELENIHVSEQNLGNTCTDLLMLTDENINDYLDNENTLLFISRGGLNNNFNMLCFEKDMLQNIYNGRNSNWFYECNGPFITRNGIETNDRSISDPISGSLHIIRTPYIRIPIDVSGMNGFISAREILTVLNSNRKAYYIEPALGEDGTQKMASHSISHYNVFGYDPNFVSANHCQGGSSILIYTLKVCRNPEICIRSIVFNNEDELESDIISETGDSEREYLSSPQSDDDS